MNLKTQYRIAHLDEESGEWIMGSEFNVFDSIYDANKIADLHFYRYKWKIVKEKVI